MAYVPPHKRHSNVSAKPTPVPPSIIPQFNKALTLAESNPNSRRRRDRPSSSTQGLKIVYGANSISRWFASGFSGDGEIPLSVRLEPFECEAFEQRNGEKPVVLMAGQDGEVEERPWVKIAQRIGTDLMDCYRSAIEGLDSEREEVKLSFVARMGKVLFLG